MVAPADREGPPYIGGPWRSALHRRTMKVRPTQADR